MTFQHLQDKLIPILFDDNKENEQIYRDNIRLDFEKDQIIITGTKFSQQDFQPNILFDHSTLMSISEKIDHDAIDIKINGFQLLNEDIYLKVTFIIHYATLSLHPYKD